jgi:hypothetical protein
MEEEEGAVTKVDAVWPREFAPQRNKQRLFMLD